MTRKERLNSIILLSILLLLLVLTCGCAGTSVANSGIGDSRVSKDHPMLQYFIAAHPDNKVVKWVLGDVNSDGQEDLVVIYNISKATNRMLVVLNMNGEYQCTNEVPAPVEHQQIQFKDIDNKPPTELIVQGMKGTRAGLAIYRVEGKSLVNLFGEGMVDCCN
ncbi:MAG: putative rabe protein [Firmicutes bacterium]|nr:putative rabe protein [Bacillota bacterium]